MFSYPHTIDNGVGESLPSCAVSPRQREKSWKWSLAYQRKGEEPRFAGVGETVVFKRGEVHRFWNAGSDEPPMYCHLTGGRVRVIWRNGIR